MSRKQKGTKGRRQTIRVWSHEQALGAVPYITSVMRSLREHRLEAQRHQLQGRRLAAKPGRPNRDDLLAQEGAAQAARLAGERFHEALAELQSLDVYCVDAVQGQALIPFVYQQQLAWFVFDLFDRQPLQSWRYHTDPLDVRRPVKEVLEGSSGTTMLA
jgi:hypothetical protein